MLDWLLDPFAGDIRRRALGEVLLLSLACGPLGVWVLRYRQSYAAESIPHAMLPGLVIAALAGCRCWPASPSRSRSCSGSG
jgi:ABC-type Mn2+/Zn2+ transport system permease subunit